MEGNLIDYLIELNNKIYPKDCSGKWIHFNNLSRYYGIDLTYTDSSSPEVCFIIIVKRRE